MIIKLKIIFCMFNFIWVYNYEYYVILFIYVIMFFDLNIIVNQYFFFKYNDMLKY